MGKVKRDSNWKNPARITEIIAILYSTPLSKLHYGFLQEHGNSFFRIISANLSTNLNNYPFLTVLNKPDNHPISDQIVTRDLLTLFICSHQNNFPGDVIPETMKYLPTNETTMITAPSLCE